MPIGNYSYQTVTTGTAWQAASAISEPRQQGYAIDAKEPERQSTAQRGSRSRGSMNEGYNQQDQPRSRRATAASRRGAQARRGGTAQSTRRVAGPMARTSRTKKSRRGFAAMSSEQQREIARKGGLTVSRNRRHMADIGRIGGEHSHGGRRARR